VLLEFAGKLGTLTAQLVRGNRLSGLGPFFPLQEQVLEAFFAS
jgi:hypothetical protein